MKACDCVPNRYYKLVGTNLTTFKYIGKISNSDTPVSVFCINGSTEDYSLRQIPSDSALEFEEVPGPTFCINYDKLALHKKDIHSKFHSLWTPTDNPKNILVSEEFIEYLLEKVLECMEEN